MKRILSFILVVVTMIVACSSLVACGGRPKFNFDVAEKNLKENGYTINHSTEKKDFFRLGNIGYAIEEYLSAKKGGDSIVIIKFKTVKDARLYYALKKEEIAKGESEYRLNKRLLRKYGDEMSREKRNSLERYINDFDERVWGRSGKYVWYGTKDAAKDTKR